MVPPPERHSDGYSFAARHPSLLGHSSVESTMIYLHILDRPGAGAPSPLDM